MSYRLPRIVVAAIVAAAPFASAQPAETQVERGKYLVELGGCTDCHTPGNFLGHPDMTRYLAGPMSASAFPDTACSSART